MTSAVDIVRRFRQLRVLLIGDAMLDTYFEGTAERLCTEGPVPIVRKTSEYRAPGGAANTAANLRALGAEVIFLGVTGQDLAGMLLRSALRERGVSDTCLVDDPSTSTTHKLRILADGQYVVRFDEGGARRCSAATQQRLLAHLEDAFAACDVVVISDYGYDTASDTIVARLRALRRARPCPLVIDSKDLLRFRAAGATVVKPNLYEAQLLVAQGRAVSTTLAGTQPTPAEVERLGQHALTLLDAEYAAVTLGGAGVCLVGVNQPAVHLPAYPVENANDVGAGDSFAAAMALGLAAEAPPAEAARIGIDAAGIAVTKRWTAVVQAQELLQRVSLREHATDERARATGNAASTKRAVTRLKSVLAKERQAGRIVVFTNGVFDILHAGHVQFLRQAKALGDVLVVGVNSDQSARRLKGKSRPITGERDRLALVAALDAVDHAVLFDEETPAEIIRALRPHIHVKGGDYADEALPEAEAVREVGGEVVILPLVGSLSTSGVIDRILALAADGQIDGRIGVAS